MITRFSTWACSNSKTTDMVRHCDINGTLVVYSLLCSYYLYTSTLLYCRKTFTVQLVIYNINVQVHTHKKTPQNVN